MRPWSTGVPPSLVILHRLLFPATGPEETARHSEPRELDLDGNIWIFYTGRDRYR